MTTNRPITFKATCAIARYVIERRPHFDDSDWKEAVKVVAIKQGWEAPTNELLGRALSAVERAAAKSGVRRPLPAAPEPPPPGETGRELTRAEAREALLSLALRFPVLARPKVMPR